MPKCNLPMVHYWCDESKKYGADEYVTLLPALESMILIDVIAIASFEPVDRCYDKIDYVFESSMLIERTEARRNWSLVLRAWRLVLSLA